MTDVEKFSIDYSSTSNFKGIRILFDYLNEGIEYVKQNQISDVCVWTNGNWEKQTTNFEFLHEIPLVSRFDWIVPLSKSSDLSGLYTLKNLKSFRWDVDNDFTIDFSRLITIESLNIGYNSKIINWNDLINLKELYLQSIKADDLSFLNKLKNLEKIRIINSGINSLAGIEANKNLKELRIVKCSKLTNIDITISRLTGLEKLSIEKCKNLEINGQEYERKIKMFSIK